MIGLIFRLAGILLSVGGMFGFSLDIFLHQSTTLIGLIFFILLVIGLILFAIGRIVADFTGERE